MLNRLYLHVVWTTRYRERAITKEAAEFLSRFLPTVGRQERAEVLALGIVRTHVHVVVKVHATTRLPRLLQRWKGGSAFALAREGIVRPRGLQWAKAYSATSVSPRQVGAAMEYVRTQPLRHPEDAIAGWIPVA